LRSADRNPTILYGYTIGLYAGGNLLASTSQASYPALNGDFVTATVLYNSLGSAYIGQSLEIRLISTAWQTNFDNVRLMTTRSENYAYDNEGNRLSGTGQDQSSNGSHNRLLTDGSYNFTYDGEGNLTQKTLISNGRVTLYGWDHRNRLTQVQEKVTSNGAVLKTIQFTGFDALDAWRSLGKRSGCGR